MTLRLFDTYARSIRDFEPLDPAEVRMYTCGPTVYNYAHIGNLRTYVFEDALRRVLEFNGYRVWAQPVLHCSGCGQQFMNGDRLERLTWAM